MQENCERIVLKNTIPVSISKFGKNSGRILNSCFTFPNDSKRFYPIPREQDFLFFFTSLVVLIFFYEFYFVRFRLF
ncbi:hypothetical protein RCL_jg13057.t1 [Rhizophagus clarus]|uniref:Uncharacterized protein n=1 Tax=Rhizophagus clarus TaxID=94130 RepID=A0A8H3QBX6_9GLOM|nr:hypothetical protein RCL_jg13057.t1 [Rhizophagus clarus]